MTIAEFKTDNGIQTNELLNPGYVWFDCQKFGLEDNTQGKIGMHVVYRPLHYKSKQYEGWEAVTDEMAEETRKHYELQEAEQSRQQQLARKRDWEEIEASKNREPSTHEKACCPKCGSVCYGDCES